MLPLKTIALLVAAGLCEIGGGYLVWLWLRDQRAALLGALGGLALFSYGAIMTLQPAHFGRAYAAYGGAFIVMALLWGWVLDRNQPDAYDWLGAALCVAGVGVMMFAPRGT